VSIEIELLQMLDMIKPQERTKISLADLKRCSMTPIFFDTFFNLEKYLDHEQRDPFASQRELDEDGNEVGKGKSVKDKSFTISLFKVV
jgi:serine/threonine-protein phosphatase 2A regulatory subunit B''